MEYHASLDRVITAPDGICSTDVFILPMSNDIVVVYFSTDAIYKIWGDICNVDCNLSFT